MDSIPWSGSSCSPTLAHRLGAEVEDSAASEVYTVRELVELVRRNMGKAARQASGWNTVFEAETTDPAGARHYPRAPGGELRLVAVRQMRASGLRTFSSSCGWKAWKICPTAPYVLCPNHSSYLDAPILTAALPWKAFHNVFYVGTSEIFGAGSMRQCAQFLHLIPVDPDSNLVPAMRAGAYGLRAGKILVMYPEGERSIEGPPKKFKKGAAILSQHLNVPIVPGGASTASMTVGRAAKASRDFIRCAFASASRSIRT